MSRASSTGHQAWSASASDARRDERREHADEPRLEPASQRVRHAWTLRRKRRAAYFAPARVSAAGNAHCAGRAGERERPRRVGERGNGRVRGQHDPAVGRLEPVVGDEPGEQRVVPETRA